MKVTDTEEGRNRRTKKGKTRKRRERDRAKRRGEFNSDKEKRKLNETVEDKEIRLEHERTLKHQCHYLYQLFRLEKIKVLHHQQMAAETPEERAVRLERKRDHQQDSETPEERALRLQHLRDLATATVTGYRHGNATIIENCICP